MSSSEEGLVQHKAGYISYNLVTEVTEGLILVTF